MKDNVVLNTTVKKNLRNNYMRLCRAIVLLIKPLV